MTTISTDRKADAFWCADCGTKIISLPAVDPPPTVCALCFHLREFVQDEAEREAMRKRLQHDC